MTEGDRADRDFLGDHAAEIGRQRRIVIARDPDPVATRLQGRERLAVGGGQPVMGGAVVKAVAERDHHARVVPRDDGSEAAERRHGIVRRQQHAAACEAGTFFQMQVGDHQQALLFPEQRAGEIGDEFDAGDGDSGARGGGFVVQELRACRHVLSIASLTSSSAVSASSSSEASP